jgi:hypothetical protein
MAEESDYLVTPLRWPLLGTYIGEERSIQVCGMESQGHRTTWKTCVNGRIILKWTLKKLYGGVDRVDLASIRDNHEMRGVND